MRFSKELKSYAQELYERQDYLKGPAYNLREIALLLKERFGKGPKEKTLRSWAEKFRWIKKRMQKPQNNEDEILKMHKEIHKSCLNLLQKRLLGQDLPGFDLKDLINLYEKTFKNLNQITNEKENTENFTVHFISPDWLINVNAKNR